MRHTAETLAALIRREMEPDTAETLLAALRPLDGQPITPRLVDALPGGRLSWRLTRAHGWTRLTNAAYDRDGTSSEGLSLLLAKSEAAVPLSVAWVERENPQVFRDRRARNAQRATALADPARLAAMAEAMTALLDLQAQLDDAKGRFAALTGPGTPLSPCRYDLERACGLRL